MPTFEKPSVADLRHAADQLGMNPSMMYLNTVQDIVAPLVAAYAALDAVPDEKPAVKYPRDGGWRPSADENKLGAWYVKTSIKGKASGKLAGRRVALKDNVCLAGVPMMVGAALPRRLGARHRRHDRRRASSTPAARSPARRCANITACPAAATRARPARCRIRESTASPPAARRRAAPRWSRPAKCRWRSAATRPARSAFRRAIAASSA